MVVWAECARVVGEQHVSTAVDDLVRHSTSSWTSAHPQIDDKKLTAGGGGGGNGGNGPALFCVVYPASTAEVAAVVKICHARKVPVTAYSGGTSIEGGYAPTRGGVCLDLTRMNAVVALQQAP